MPFPLFSRHYQNKRHFRIEKKFDFAYGTAYAERNTFQKEVLMANEENTNQVDDQNDKKKKKQELNEEQLDQVNGGQGAPGPSHHSENP